MSHHSIDVLAGYMVHSGYPPLQSDRSIAGFSMRHVKQDIVSKPGAIG
jgi:hypothetical protein